MRYLVPSKFVRDEDGGALIEGVLWIPFFLFLFLAFADASIIFMHQARMTRILQDGNRHLAVGALDDCAALVDWVEDNIDDFAPSVTARCIPSADGYRIQASVPATEIDLSGSAGMLGGLQIRAETTNFREAL